MPTISQAVGIVAAGALIAAATAVTAMAGAVGGPGGFGNAQDTINALQAQGFNVLINGAVVYPLSGCKVLGIEGLRNDNIDGSGAIIDRTKMTTVWVDISCKGG
ncbi:hypothetical protein [Mycolicibacterium aubagnense]|uniref:Uncharacterized protein n=1 Tax=Mycolicibacterium aubagnense TaxID=319707 RepID=A0ABM7IEA3_9MYCO|nr:hypothetical protein [Mycolicibacterium aubagnense]TLH49409.1 hypothetical protein C1S80_27150 [Mycolicibacterium aubagnense]WGI33191.1 hypothetical protein QDT91_01995 [Mycolicibacterium aubagnense]BBX85103.1 hypothetical protein MAUB_29760 [Mycolicibacterium aubagnense]